MIPLSRKQQAQRERDIKLREVLESLEQEDRAQPMPTLKRLAKIWIEFRAQANSNQEK